MTPFGKPPDPDENGRMAKSSFGLSVTRGRLVPSSFRRSDTDSHSSSSPMTNTRPVSSCSSASFARCTNCRTAMIHFALASLSWLVSSLLVKWGLAHVTIAPSWRIPRKTIANSGTFGAKIATTSPFLIPLLLRAEANFLLNAFNSENVYEVFVEPHT